MANWPNAQGMFTFAPAPGQPKSDLYHELVGAALALTDAEPDTVANMANLAALIWTCLPDLNWAGFYRLIPAHDGAPAQLLLGPFMGKPACVRIALGQGVCGAAAVSGITQCVADVHAFAGHIACDAHSRSELVVPVWRDGMVIAVIDLDSPLPARFDHDDAAGMEAVASAIAARI